MENFTIVKINRGRATHLGKIITNEDGKKRTSVGCGSYAHSNQVNTVNTYLDVKLENITCKKCKARYEEMNKVAEVKYEEMDALEQLKYFKENKISFNLAK
jgi:hypothetical protein